MLQNGVNFWRIFVVLLLDVLPFVHVENCTVGMQVIEREIQWLTVTLAY